MTQKWIGTPPDSCDLCSMPITNEFTDGATIIGPWANMCPLCVIQFGSDLGQTYEKQGEDWIKTKG